MQHNKLYVGNLSFSTTENDLVDTFGHYGDLDEITIMTDHKTGRSKGFAFITFANANDADAALELDGRTLKGQTIQVNMAKSVSA